MRVDVVGERVDGILVGGVPLHRDLDRALVALALEVDDPLVHRVLRGVHVLDEVADPALVVELDRRALGALVDELDAQPARQEGRLAQALRQRVRCEVDLLEDLLVGQEADRRAGAVSRPDLLHVVLRLAALELLAVDRAVHVHVGDQPFGKRVHDRDSDAVQAAGNLVAVAAELAAGVQLRQHDCQRRQAGALDDADGNAAAFVDDGD